MPAIKKVRLVGVSVVPFQRSEATHMDEWMMIHHSHAGVNQAAAFINMADGQVVFVRVMRVVMSKGVTKKVYHSQKFRIEDDEPYQGLGSRRKAAKWTAEWFFKVADAFGVDMDWVRKDMEAYFRHAHGERPSMSVSTITGHRSRSPKLLGQKKK